jgi:hypothetical protein
MFNLIFNLLFAHCRRFANATQARSLLHESNWYKMGNKKNKLNSTHVRDVPYVNREAALYYSTREL